MKNLEKLRMEIIEELNEAEKRFVEEINKEVFEDEPSRLEKAHTFEKDVMIIDGMICFNAEGGSFYASYYPETQDEPWIASSLERIAKKRGMYWEWVNPGMIQLAK